MLPASKARGVGMCMPQPLQRLQDWWLLRKRGCPAMSHGKHPGTCSNTIANVEAGLTSQTFEEGAKCNWGSRGVLRSDDLKQLGYACPESDCLLVYAAVRGCRAGCSGG